MSLILPSIGAFGHTAAGGAYTPSFVDNQGSASLTKTGTLASDSVYFWFSGWFNFSNDGSTEKMYEISSGRSVVTRSAQATRVTVTNTSAIDVLDIYAPDIAAGNLTHVFFWFDGTVSTGGWGIYINGSDVTGSCTVNTTWASGTVDHSRTSVLVLTGVDVQQVGDLLIGANAPPALSAVYDGGAVDPTGVTASVKFVGNAAYWNASPNGYTTSGTFVDNA